MGLAVTIEEVTCVVGLQTVLPVASLVRRDGRRLLQPDRGQSGRLQLIGSVERLPLPLRLELREWAGTGNWGHTTKNGAEKPGDSNMTTSRAKSIFVGAVVICVVAVHIPRVLAAEECQTPPAEGTQSTWAEDTRVMVFVDPSLPGWSSSSFQSVLKNVFSKWEFVGGSGVTFTVVSDAARAQSPPPNSIGITAGSTSHTVLTRGGFNLRSARMYLDDFSSNPDGMRNPLSHEIGHTFGLDDCRSCTPGTSVMAAGGLPAPTQCDRQAVKANGNYTGIDLPGLGGGRDRPDHCADCSVRYCTVTVLCHCRNGDCNVRQGRLVGDWECQNMGSTCRGGGGCCSASAGSPVGASSSVCGQWEQATDCEWGEACCFNPEDFPPVAPPPCTAYGWYEEDQRSACEADGSRECEPVGVYLEAGDQDVQTPQLCWAPTDAPAPLISCGSLGGDYCSQAGVCPDGYSFLGVSSDCDPCCVTTVPSGCQSTGCPAGSCDWQIDNCGEEIFCGECGPSCGAMGGDYCSQTGGCPAGFNALGPSYDCATCCATIPCQSTGCPAGSCGWKTDNCGTSIYCGQCAPSCGAMGGDYCSQANSCPGGYTSLGASSDCTRCCQSPPSCGAMGGDYCSQTGGCPAGYISLGPSNDCHPCCVSN
jgi:hypothetical protein